MVRTVLRLRRIAKLAGVAQLAARVPGMVPVFPRALRACVALTSRVRATPEPIFARRARNTRIARRLTSQ